MEPITDRRTALRWEKLSDDESIHNKDQLLDWHEAFAKIAALNTPPCFAGHCDWRLPNVIELESLVHYGTGGPVRAPTVPGWLRPRLFRGEL
jgi:hypothetical protein